VIFKISFDIFDKYLNKTLNKNEGLMGDIGILGGGWLGMALAKEGINMGYKVRVSSTSKEKANQLLAEGYSAYFLKISEIHSQGQLEFFKDLNTLVITIPPGLRKNPELNYVGLLDQVVKEIEYFKIQKVIFTSSTSVYGFQKGVITEESALLGNNTSAQQIIKVEQKLLENDNFACGIVRLGGLMGPDRHPIFSLSGEKNLPNPNSPINFIHQIDAVNILLKLIENFGENKVFNGVSPFHPTRKDYYTQMAEIAELTAPTFEETGKIRGVVKAEKVVRELGCQYVVKNLLILN
tara:strand:+ start:4423 stop:5304 length:882 start_codon:yes stop_codon:yes gene_type:complete